MIDWNESAKLNGCTIEWIKAWFKKYPGSSKRIIRICNICNCKSEIGFQNHSDLCHKCSHNTPEYLWEHPRRLIQYYIDNPEARDAQRKRLLQFNKNNPEAGEEHSRWLVQYYIDNPEAREAARLKTIEQMKDPLMRELLSKTLKQVYIDNPNMFDERDKMMRGGNDIINHHFIYDHNHPENHTVGIIRSEHSSHHHWMKRNGLEVPHLNVTEENKDIFKGRK